MANHTFQPVYVEEGKSFADLSGVKQDLELTLRFIGLLERGFVSSADNSDLQEALTVAILVQYSRAFTTGYRERLCESDLHLSPSDLELHTQFRNWRDKHIAHSVNPFEQNQVVARFVSERVHEEGVYDVSVQQSRVIALGGKELADLRRLIAQILPTVDQRIEIERERVLRVVQAIPTADLLAGSKKLWPDSPGLDSVGKRRKSS